MSDLICPYCNADCGHPDDCYDTETTYEWNCGKCDKNFTFTLDYTVTYSESQADCLNGGTHDWKPYCGYPEEYFARRRRCSICDQVKILDKDK